LSRDEKVFRDPLYNYVGIDPDGDGWLLDVIDSPEVQRLRRIHQLGVSSFTYPGADHSRLCHSLGVLYLMDAAWETLRRKFDRADVRRGREVLLGAAIAHDVGHGPFSHLFEPCLGIDHEEWSLRIIRDEDSGVNRGLRRCDSALPEQVAALIDPNDYSPPAWQKSLISSQLDVDRLDYLRRDSLFTGAGYGRFDWNRLITTVGLHPGEQGDFLVWPAKAALAIEEYIFARFYMYQNVYLHKTTRGFEQLLQAMWRHARQLREDGVNVGLMPAIESFWDADDPEIGQYLAMEEFTVLSQIQAWANHDDPGLRDLASRFLHRRPFACIKAPKRRGLDNSLDEWEEALRELVAGDVRFRPADLYLQIDRQKPKYHLPYFSEKETEEQSDVTAIRVMEDGGLIEIDELLPRLKSITKRPVAVTRYYLPKELRDEAEKLRRDFRTSSS
jgi:HD superfamily phosphohydrolase